ncbi:TPA: hypothetical protein ACNACB_000054 [Escherichia coli]|uniref:hypothetical protein n=1 Tax=Enterobacter wuhouensis TaxID=2529381 RepID=UPI002FCEB57C|nr:hypothetical protein [Escherichia coli]
MKKYKINYTINRQSYDIFVDYNGYLDPKGEDAMLFCMNHALQFAKPTFDDLTVVVNEVVEFG